MIRVNGRVIEMGHFPDGTLLVKHKGQASTCIEWQFENNEELVALYFLAKHIKTKWDGRIRLVMKYIPNARQDRVHGEEDIFTLKYFAEMINSLGFEDVSVLDAHSNVALALIDRVKQLSVKPYIEEAMTLSRIEKDKDIIFFPDEGSSKRYSGMVNFPHAFGYKKRRWEDGEIVELEVIGEVPKAPFNALIIDDISSFGGTFYHAAKKLKELGADKIYLYITHCENSILQGDLIKSGLIERIYTTDSLFTGEHELITVSKLR
ncbi:MAG: ribose-phosphate pyrophosphokinase [Cellulosilyticaceae bacterium]